MPARRFHPFAAFLVAAIAAACARTIRVNEVDTPECRDRKPSAASAIEWTTGGSQSAESLQGIVVRADTRQPVRVAQVILASALAPTGAMTDSLGRFRILGVRGTPVILRTRGLGMITRTDTLLAFDSSRMLTIPLDPSVVDGPCSGFATVLVRKPWWQFW